MESSINDVHTVWEAVAADKLETLGSKFGRNREGIQSIEIFADVTNEISLFV